MTANPSTLSQLLGADPWAVADVQPWVAADQKRSLRTLTRFGAVSITRGRRGPTGPVDPAVCTFDAEMTDPAMSPADPLQLGDPLTVRLTDEALGAIGLPAGDPAGVRYVGQLVELRRRQERIGSVSDRLTVSAVGNYQLLNVNVGDQPWPIERDDQRVLRIADRAQQEHDGRIPNCTAPAAGLFTVQRRDVDRQNARTLIEQTAEDGAGLLVETRTGGLMYQSAGYRSRDRLPVLTLADDEVAAGADWQQTKDGMVNDLTITYGVDVPAGTKVTVSIADDWAATPNGGGPGRVTAEITTQHEATGDPNLSAYGYGRLMVGRYGRPRWTFSGVRVDAGNLLRLSRLDQLRKLLALDVGDLVRVAGVGRSSPYASGSWLWVEGVSESITRDSWQLLLYLSPYATTATSARYQDVPSSIHFDAYPGLSPLTFLQAFGSFDLPPAS